MQSRAEALAFLQVHPSNALAWTILGHIHEHLDEDGEAERAYKKAIGYDPKAFQALTGLGVVYRKKKEYDKAMEYYKESIKINPNYAQTYTSMAVIEIKRHRDQYAVELAKKAFELDKRDPVIAANLAVAYHYSQRFAERDRMHEESRKLGYRKMESLDRIFKGEITVRD